MGWLGRVTSEGLTLSSFSLGSKALREHRWFDSFEFGTAELIGAGGAGRCRKVGEKTSAPTERSAGDSEVLHFLLGFKISLREHTRVTASPAVTSAQICRVREQLCTHTHSSLVQFSA